MSSCAQHTSPAPTSTRLRCPVQSRLNPHVEQASRAALAWARRLGLLTSKAQVQAFARARFGHAIARAFPDADRASLRLATDWLLLSTRIDDEVEASADPRASARWLTQLSKTLRDPTGARVSDDPFVHAMAELGARLAHLASPAVLTAFIAEVDRLFAAFIREIELRPTSLSLATYFELRECSVSMATYYALAPMLDGFALGPGDRGDAELDALMARASLTIALVNDLSSYARELEAGNPFNVVTVLVRSEGLALGDAVDAAIELHNRELASLLLALDELAARDRARGARTKIAAMLRRCITGHFAWVLESERYTLDA